MVKGRGTDYNDINYPGTATAISGGVRETFESDVTLDAPSFQTVNIPYELFFNDTTQKTYTLPYTFGTAAITNSDCRF